MCEKMFTLQELYLVKMCLFKELYVTLGSVFVHVLMIFEYAWACRHLSRSCSILITWVFF